MNDSAATPAAGLPPAVVLGAALAWLAVLYLIAAWAERRAAAGRSVVANPWVYALSMGVYCTAWTYFGSVGRAATTGLAFLPIYLGPTLAMVLAWVVLRRMVRIAHRQRITSIADFIASRHGKSPLLAGLVTVVALIGVVPYVALQLKAIGSGMRVLAGDGLPWLGDGTLAVAMLLAGFTIAFGTRHLDGRVHLEGMVAAVAAESVLKLLAFLAIGSFAVWGLNDGPAALWDRALAQPALAALVRPSAAPAPVPWFTLILLSMLSVLLLPRQFQIMVVENLDERHVRRAAWVFPAYLFAINLFVLPLALAGLLHFGVDSPGLHANPENFVLSLPLAGNAPELALLAFLGGFSAATGMVIVEATAVATMVSNDLVLPLLVRFGRLGSRREHWHNARLVLTVRRLLIVALLMLGWLYYRMAGEAYALVSIGLISFAAVAQFAPALFGGLFWKGGRRDGAVAGLIAGTLVWAWTLMLPSIARSGWIDDQFLREGAWGIGWLKPEVMFGLTGLDNLSHALFWSLLLNAGLYVGVSLLRPPTAAETAQALRFVEVMDDQAQTSVFWRGRAQVGALSALLARFVGAERAAAVTGPRRDPAELADAALVHEVETQLAGVVGSASARVMVASIAQEEQLDVADVLRIVDEARELRHVNEELVGLDRLKDDFMSSVTHELRTPLTSIRALAELMRDEPDMDEAQRAQFLGIMVAECERLGRLVNQVLDMAKIESGHAEWRSNEIDLRALLQQAATATGELFRERGATLSLQLPDGDLPLLHADQDRLMQVLMNLLSNAAKFVPAGRGEVTLRLTHGARGVSIEVQDNGSGVPADQQQLVFEKFRQGGDARHRPSGTGLGLPISRQIVEHFGGRMWLRSPPGGGSTFGFDLPWQ